MSTVAQLKGRSRKRQLEKSKAYAAAHGLYLQDDFDFEDIGVSAFKGANVKGGALGRFLDAVESQKVEPGSYLLVESLDRISRQEVRKSLALFLRIIDAKINIVTLADEHIYTTDKTDEIELITSLVMLSRAHDESRMKSQRVSDAWASKRANATTRKITGICPAWLKLSRDRTTFNVIEERANVVRTIFQDSAAGIGNYTITRLLNKREVPTFGSSNGWHNSYVAKILENRAVIGEFQPHKILNAKRVATGDPIKNYFPAIIEKELFFQAKIGRARRRVNGAGRKGLHLTNLFSGVATCAYCGAPMKFENKGTGPKGGAFLVCDSAKRGIECNSTRWRYDQFEASFLAFVQEIDLEPILRSNEETIKRAVLDQAISAVHGQLKSTELELNRVYELFAHTGEGSNFVAAKVRALELRLVEFKNMAIQKESERAVLTADIGNFYESKEQIKALIEKLQNPDTQELYRLRSQIAAKLKSLATSIEVFPAGLEPWFRRELSKLKQSKTPHDRDTASLIGTYEGQIAAKDATRYFTVNFKDGTSRSVSPSDDDPLSFETQLVTSSTNFRGFDAGGKELVNINSAAKSSN